MRKKPLTDKEGNVRELTHKDIRAMRPIAEVLPAELLDIILKRKRGERGPQQKPKKISVTQRYSPDVVHYFKATGKGWQNRIEQVLKIFIEGHPTFPKKLEAKKQQKTAKNSRQHKQSRSAA